MRFSSFTHVWVHWVWIRILPWGPQQINNPEVKCPSPSLSFGDSAVYADVSSLHILAHRPHLFSFTGIGLSSPSIKSMAMNMMQLM
jgi:hypothetical protein